MYSPCLMDLHCDTLTDCMYPGEGAADTLDDPKRVLSLSDIPPQVRWGQFYAVFIPDELRGQAAVDYFEQNRANFLRQMEKFSHRVAPCQCAADLERAWGAGKTAAFLTVENGCVLAGDLGRVALLRRQGVRCITLVWNGENEIGSGNTTSHGLSPFGRAVIPELEKNGILIDVSHLNDAGFDDLLPLVTKPFVASHSNARAICAHKRNLTDGQILEMVKRDCLIGLNYYVDFLRDGGQGACLDDLYRHAAHFLELGAGRCLALGSDFDGAELPDSLNTPSKAAELYGYLLSRGLSETLVRDIFFENALRFFRKNLL